MYQKSRKQTFVLKVFLELLRPGSCVYEVKDFFIQKYELTGSVTVIKTKD